jgi:hypothetical protein
MKNILKILAFTLMAMLLLGIKGAKAGEEYKKVIKKEFAINADAQVNISNKFGKVHFTNWEKNEVAIEVTITVDAKSEQAAEKRFSKIDINISGSNSLVTATTKIDDGISGNKGYFSIDYMVHIPVTVNLDVTNKFGDIFINELTGKSRIDLGYGNLEVRKLDHADNLMEIKFGKARINSMKGAVLTLKYSTMKLDYAGSLRLNSKFSDLDAQRIIALNMVLEGGNLDMQKSSVLESRSKFSDIDVERIDKSLNLDIQYGQCRVGDMAADFSDINIRNKYGDVTIDMAESARYNLDAEMKFCELDYPEDKAWFSFRSGKPTEKTYRGVIGGGEEKAASSVTVRSEFGNVKLR